MFRKDEGITIIPFISFKLIGPKCGKYEWGLYIIASLNGARIPSTNPIILSSIETLIIHSLVGIVNGCKE